MSIAATLPARYEIRPLGPEHTDWASAIVAHSNMFYSRLWPVIYPESKTARAYSIFKSAGYLVTHQIESGHSLGVFDKQWEPKNPESSSVGGKLLWDLTNETASADELLAQMDFPLVSVALSYDSFHALDMEKMASLISCLPAFGLVYMGLEQADKRDASTWKATNEGEVLFRNATSTRHDHEGKGIMKALAYHLMRETADKGFRGIQIEAISDAVSHVWRNPPAPYSAAMVAELDPATFEFVDENGNKTFPLRPSSQRIQKIFVNLK